MTTDAIADLIMGLNGVEDKENDAVRLNRMHPSHPAVRTHSAAPGVIEGTDLPSSGDALSPHRANAPSASARAVSSAAADAGVGKSPSFPNVAWASIQVALLRETYGSQKLKSLADGVRKQIANIDLLLDLNSELTSLPDKDSHEITPKMGKILEKLKEENIEIWKGEKKITKEKLGELKAQISSQIDKLRTALQTTISTEIQPEANNLQAIMNILQQIIQTDARLKRKSSELPR